MMVDEIRPDTISISGQAELDNLDDVIDRLGRIRKLDAGDEFSNQLVDLSGEDAFLLFLNEPSEDSPPENLSFTVGTEPFSAEPGMDNILTASANFSYRSLETFEIAFNELLTETLPDQEFEIVSMSMSFSLDMEFGDIEPLQPVFESTEHNVSGVQFKREGYSFIFQEVDDGVGVNVIKKGEFVASNGGFIVEQVEIVIPFIKEVIYGT